MFICNCEWEIPNKKNEKNIFIIITTHFLELFFFSHQIIELIEYTFQKGCLVRLGVVKSRTSSK